MPLSEAEGALLLVTARQSIEYGLSHNRALPVTPAAHPPLDKPGASFVTLHRHGELRGCIGSLQASRPMLADVAENAYAAAFRDSRFIPVQANELDEIDIAVSVLSEPEALHVEDEQELLAQLRPGIDGLILEDEGKRGTFLPSVWESLPAKTDFLAHLKSKAGLPADHWSDSLKVWRYTTETFSERPAAG
jgi:AmmeMemoRadiSam system protein A